MTGRLAGAMLVLFTVGTVGEAFAQRGTIPVNIESTPPGATVFVDQEADANRIGVTPMRNVRVPRGNHTLIFKLANHETTQLAVYFRRRRETFRATLNALSVIDIQGGNAASTGAAIRIDGQPVGNVPHRQTVQPGRHLVQVGREGYVTFNQWVDVAGAQVLTLPVILEAQAPSTGSLLVAGDVSGAAIYVDGTPRGSTPTVIEGLTEGEHTIEVRANDPALQPFRQTIRIIAGERMTLNPTLRPAPAAGGSLRVISNVRGAIISVDGEVIGEAPATADSIPPGEHIVEARADGYEPAQQPVTIEGGRQRVISITLQAVAQAPGRIVVNADVDGATVLVDGEERGSPPVVIEGADAGTHAVIVRADGYEEHRETCNVGPGRNCEVTARLRPIGTPVRVEANITGAELVVDGEVLGPVPWEGTIPVGSHLIEIRADGYRSYTAQVALRPSRETRVFNVGLVGEDEMTPEERQERRQARRERHRQAVSRSGATLPNDLAVLDFSAGWPHLFEFRLGIGIFDWLEAGIGLRTTFYRLTEFEGRVKVGYRPVRQVSIGGQFRIGGGLGPSLSATDEEIQDLMAAGELGPNDPAPELSTNTVFFSLEALFSLHFLNAGNFTMWLGLDYHSDSWPWNGTNADCRWAGGCEPGMGDTLAAGATDMERISGRQRVTRLRLGGSLEFILSNRWNMWASFEGVLAGNDRRIFGDLWGFGNADINLYGRLGFTYKFGYVERNNDNPAPASEEPAPAEAAPAQ
ncbi:MAG: PEGA domain-containing protein [Myxococcota bacterium]